MEENCPHHKDKLLSTIGRITAVCS